MPGSLVKGKLDYLWPTTAMPVPLAVAVALLAALLATG